MAKYKKYAEYQDSGAQWLGEVPNHWGVEYSKWLFEERNIKATAHDEMLTASQKYGVIPQKMFMELEQQKVVQVLSGHDILKKTEANDFVISMRSFQGGIEFSEYSGAVSSAYVPLKPREGLSLAYYKHLFKSAPYIQALQTTTNLVRDGQALRYGNFIQVRIPLVPLEEAEKIGQFLDHETAKIDSLIAKQEKLIELLKEKRQAVISHAVTKGLNPNVAMKDSGVEWLGQVPEHWTVKPNKYLLDFVTSGSRGWAQFYADTGSLFFRIANLTRDTIEPKLESLQFVEPPQGSEGERSKIKIGDLLISITADLGSVCVADSSIQNGYVSQHVALCRPQKLYNSRWLAYYILSDSAKEQLLGSGYGGTKIQLSLEDIKELVIAVPPKEEQILIANYIDEKLNQFEHLIKQANKLVMTLQERRTALISSAVTGKIDLRNWQHPNEAKTELNL